MEALLEGLMEWIGQNTDYEAAAMPPPIIIEMSPEELTQEYYTGAPHLAPVDGVDDRVNALYARAEGPHGTIYLRAAALTDGASQFDDPLDNPVFREVLLHELVHHAQWHSGEAETWACINYGELEAYVLGGRYLAERHVTDPMPNRLFWAHRYARC
ncbi:hypothetical protein [Mesobacterium pallidum]|uniref:hypothetical protein n=1 Tax=Mesobacterium pallidum TaxID=2872037 RepID=UPI001EE282B3|nr:hypothetical protein [Mesobacterium pallidum]